MKNRNMKDTGREENADSCKDSLRESAFSNRICRGECLKVDIRTEILREK